MQSYLVAHSSPVWDQLALHPFWCPWLHQDDHRHQVEDDHCGNSDQLMTEGFCSETELDRQDDPEEIRQYNEEQAEEQKGRNKGTAWVHATSLCELLHDQQAQQKTSDDQSQSHTSRINRELVSIHPDPASHSTHIIMDRRKKSSGHVGDENAYMKTEQPEETAGKREIEYHRVQGDQVELSVTRMDQVIDDAKRRCEGPVILFQQDEEYTEESGQQQVSIASSLSHVRSDDEEQQGKAEPLYAIEVPHRHPDERHTARSDYRHGP